MFSAVLLTFFSAIISVFAYYDGRIVGGDVAHISQYPFVVSLNYEGSHMCGGSILSNVYVLTAAHCLDNIKRSKLKIYAGSKYITLPRQEISVNWTKIHENYDPKTLENDIAILRLKKPLPFGKRILPIALPAQNEEPRPNSTVLILGWGLTAENGSPSAKLRKTSLPLVDRTICKKLYSPTNIGNNVLCAGLIKGGKDSCQGDSGGPLVASDKLAGIVSWGTGCARAGYPGIYTQVSKFRNWIRNNTNV